MPLRARSSAIAAFVLLAATASRAQVPQLLGYQGRLLRADGTAATGTAAATFSVFDAESGGSTLWSETQTLGLSDGYYSTFLGLVVPPGEALSGGARWLQVQVGGETLLPRQQIGAVLFAVAARNVAGGTANVSSVKIGGQTVLDAAGRLAGSARYSAGSGIAVDDASQVVSLQGCAAGQALVHDGTAWHCSTTVTGLGAMAPLAVAGASASPVLSLTRAGSASDGYLASADWSMFDEKYDAATQCGGDLSGVLSAPVVTRLQSRPVSAAQPAPGQVLKWNGGTWEPAADASSGGTVTNVVAVYPLTGWNGTSVPQISIALASASADGYLASADWSRFDAKYDAASQCGGDLAGSWSAPQVSGIQGVFVSTSVPSTAQVLRFDGTGWAPASLGIADVGGLSSGYLDLSGNQSISGSKAFVTAPTFGTPLDVGSGGTGTATAAVHAFFAGPISGGSAAPGFRAIDPSDVPGLDAAGIVSGTLAVSRGGTGTSSLLAGGLVLGNGTGAVSSLGTGTPGQFLVSGGGAGPAWSTDGSSLTNLDATRLVNTVADARLSSNIPRLDGSPTFSGNPAFTGTPYFTGATGKFSGDGSGLTGVVASATVQVVDSGTTCTPAQKGQVRYANDHFQGCNGLNWMQLDNAPAPAIYAAAPLSGPVSGGTLVTITGANFQPLALVTIGGASCTVSGEITANSLRCTTPSGLAGPATIVVVNPDSQNGQKVNGFTFNPLPTVSSLNPASGPSVGGTPVTISGADFQSGATVTIGGSACPVSGPFAADTLRCTTSTGTLGAVLVVVTNADGGVGQKTGGFTYLAPTVTALSASAASLWGGAVVTVTGTSFATGAVVKFGTVAATTTFVDTTSLTAVVPPGSAGTVQVSVVNTDAASGATQSFTYSKFGSGADGSVSFSSALNLNTQNLSATSDRNGSNADGIAFKVSAAPSGQSIAIAGSAAGAFVPGDVVLLANLQGGPSDYSSVGNWELLGVASASGSTITTTSAIQNGYG